MLTTYCLNCGQQKTPATYPDPYCVDCATAVIEAREFATRENQDTSSMIRNALLRRTQHVNANRLDPRVPYEKTGSFHISNLGQGSVLPSTVTPIGPATE